MDPRQSRSIRIPTDSPWTVATEFRLDRAGQDWSVPIEILESGRFYRIRVEIP